MKHTNISRNKLKKFAVGIIAFVSLLSPLSASAASQHYYIRPFRNGDTVYYDNSVTQWGNVRIYLFNSSDQSHPFEWNTRPGMKRVGDSNIWQFNIPSDIPEGYTTDIEGQGYNFVIFTDGYDTGGEQTIDLGFVGNGYAYKADSWQDGKRSGYWYLYDRTAVEMHTIRQINSGNTIYFDNSGTNWSDVYVYLFSTIGGTEFYPWGDSHLKMTPVSDGSNIYKFYLDPSYNIEQYKDNFVVFNDGGNAKTIDLGYINTGYAYKVESWEDGKAVGYWYVYDKSNLEYITTNAEAYFAKLQCLPASDTNPLKWAIEYARLAIRSEIPVETEVIGNTEEYWDQAHTEEVHIYDALQTAKATYGDEPTICTFTPTIAKTIVNPQTVYRLGDTVEFRIDVSNPADFAIGATIDEALSGAEFIPGSGYSVVSSSRVDIPEIAPGGTVSVYARFVLTEDVTRQYTNTASISSATTSASGYYLNPTVTYIASANFDTQSWSDVPVPTGIADNKGAFAVLLAGGIVIIVANVIINIRRKSG